MKHGWPAKWQEVPFTDGFVIQNATGGDLAPDFLNAAEIAVRIVARTYRVDVTQHVDWVGLNRNYAVTNGGQFREVKHAG